MKHTYNGQSGELTIEHCTILRYNENGKIRKFYQQMLVQFSTSAASPVTDTFWSVSNWGPGAEARWNLPSGSGNDLKGGIKSETHASYLMAEQANKRQVDSKIKGGYTSYSEFSAGANVIPPPKLLAELGVRTHDLLRDAEPPTPETNVRWQALLDTAVKPMRTTVNTLSAIAMHSLMVGDLPAAIAERQDLIDMMGEIRTLHESTQGQLEMLTLKLAAELKK